MRPLPFHGHPAALVLQNAPSEKENFQWALDNGKLKRVPGREVKRVKRMPEEQ